MNKSLESSGIVTKTKMALIVIALILFFIILILDIKGYGLFSYIYKYNNDYKIKLEKEDIRRQISICKIQKEYNQNITLENIFEENGWEIEKIDVGKTNQEKLSAIVLTTKNNETYILFLDEVLLGPITEENIKMFFNNEVQKSDILKKIIKEYYNLYNIQTYENT